MRGVRAVPVMEVGGTHVTAALVDADAHHVLRDSHRRWTLEPSAAASTLLGRLAGCASLVGAPAGAVWGVAIPGPFDYATGIGRYHDVGKFDTLNGADVKTALAAGIRPAPGDISFVNDAHAFALGEWAGGAMTGHLRAVALTLGTGIGSAFVESGAIVDSGPSVPPEGRADLLTVGGRPLEETVSRRAIAAAYGGGVDVAEIAERARAGEHRARMVLETAFETLGAAFRPWIERFGATVVVVGGAMAGSWDLVSIPLSAGLKGTAELRPSSLGADAPLVGAAVRVRE